MGEIIVKTAEDSMHKVKIYSNRLTKEGNENKIYKGLVTVMNEYKSIAEVGAEEASKIRISGGQLGMNDFVTASDEMINQAQVSANFVNRLKATDEYAPINNER